MFAGIKRLQDWTVGIVCLMEGVYSMCTGQTTLLAVRRGGYEKEKTGDADKADFLFDCHSSSLL